MQLARNLTIRDIQDFFSKVGQVRDVRLISDRNSRRSKGIGYVEFTDPSAVTLAIKLSGQRLLGVPIMVSPTMAEKKSFCCSTSCVSEASRSNEIVCWFSTLQHYRTNVASHF